MENLHPRDPWNFITPHDADFEWEIDAFDFYTRHKMIFAILAIVYLPLTFSLQAYMKNKQPYRLIYILRFWNIAIALFSIIGTIKLAPVLIRLLISEGFMGTVCNVNRIRQLVPPEASIWVFYFNISKLPEWFDTFLIVFRKRPLIFLHYYHHIATFLFCWYANQYSPQFHSAGFFFATMNLSIHSFMYTYYTLTSFGYRPSWNKYLTAAQVSQMVFGIIFLCSIGFCENVVFSWDMPHNAILMTVGLVMYFSYFILFLQLYLNRYPSKTQSGAPKPSSPTSTKKVVKKD